MKPRRVLRSIALASLLLVGGLAPLAAQEDPRLFAQKLKSYDPQAVAAALDYARESDMKGMMEKAMPAITAALTQQLKQKNPTLGEVDVKTFLGVFFKTAFVDNGDVIEQAIVLQMLDILSKDELVALRDFYATPVGQSILKKMPIMMGRMPQMMAAVQKYIVPRALAAAQAALKKNGVDVRI